MSVLHCELCNKEIITVAYIYLLLSSIENRVEEKPHKIRIVYYFANESCRFFIHKLYFAGEGWQFYCMNYILPVKAADFIT